MEVHTLPLPPLGANCYLLKSPDRSDGLVIDPGGDPPAVLRACRAMGMTPAAILLTHGHFDHVGGVDGLLAAYPDLPVYAHRGDISPTPGQLTWQAAPSWVELRDHDTLSLAGISLHVLHAPGHSKGSVVFQAEDCLFTGDVLFSGSMGRTDFPGGSVGEMIASLSRLAALPGDYRVYPGHMDSTTLETERKYNPYLREAMGR